MAQDNAVHILNINGVLTLFDTHGVSLGTTGGGGDTSLFALVDGTRPFTGPVTVRPAGLGITKIYGPFQSGGPTGEEDGTDFQIISQNYNYGVVPSEYVAMEMNTYFQRMDLYDYSIFLHSGTRITGSLGNGSGFGNDIIATMGWNKVSGSRLSPFIQESRGAGTVNDVLNCDNGVITYGSTDSSHHFVGNSVVMSLLPLADPHVAGELYTDAGVMMVSNG